MLFLHMTWHIKGTVHPNLKILSLYAQPHVDGKLGAVSYSILSFDCVGALRDETLCKLMCKRRKRYVEQI